MNLLLMWILNALALWLTALLPVGLSFEPMTFGAVIIAALILGLVNAVIRPIMVVLTLPVNILTLGLFTLVINAVVLYIVNAFSPAMQLGGFLSVVFAALVLSIISAILSSLFGVGDRRKA